MIEKYGVSIKLAVSAVIALMSLAVPGRTAGIVFGAAVIMAMGIFFSRYILYGLFSAIIISSLILSNTNTFSHYFAFNFTKNAFNTGIPLQPDKTLEITDKIFVTCPGIKIIFDPAAENTVKFNSAMTIDKTGDSLRIGCAEDGKFSYELIIGTRKKISEISFTASGLRIQGNTGQKIDKVIFNGSGIESEADITAGTLTMEGASLRIIGNIKSDLLLLKGDGMSLDATADSRNIEVTGNNITLNLDMRNAEKFTAQGNDMTGKITYTDCWEGERDIIVKGNSNSVEAYVRDICKGSLKGDGIKDILKY